jgi:low affinity Fe/Cu permease
MAGQQPPTQSRFAHFARSVSAWAGHPAAFIGALSIIVLWAVGGPVFGFSDTWQLVINTGTTIVTFLMVFLIQNTQNRDAIAMHLKLDELIRTNRGANNTLLDMEELSEEDLVAIRSHYEALARKARRDPSVLSVEDEADGKHRPSAASAERPARPRRPS